MVVRSGSGVVLSGIYYSGSGSGTVGAIQI